MTYRPIYLKPLLYLYMACIVLLLPVACKPKKQMVTSGSPSDKTAEFSSLYIEACKEKNLGNVSKAIELFNSCKKLKPEEASVYYNLSQLYDTREGYMLCLEYAHAAFRLDPANVFYATHYVTQLEHQGNYTEAITVLSKTLAANPRDKDLYMQCISEYNNKRDMKGALQMWEQYEATFGFKKLASEEKYKLYKLTDNSVNAFKELDKLQSHYPAEYKYFLDAGNDYLQAGNNAKALENYTKAETLKPNTWEVCKALSKYWKLAGDNTKADYYFVKAFADESTDIRVKHKDINSLISGQAKDSNSDKINSQVAQNIASANQSSGDALSLSGSLFFLVGNYQAAIQSHTKAIAIDPNIFNSWKELFMSLDKTEQYGRLKQETTTALEYYPANALVYEYQAVAYNKLKDYTKAIEAAHTAKSYAIDDAGESRALIQEGLADYGLAKYNEAYSIFQAQLLKTPADGDLQDYLGNIQFKRNNIEDAVKFWILAKKYGCKNPFLDKKINDTKLYE